MLTPEFTKQSFRKKRNRLANKYEEGWGPSAVIAATACSTDRQAVEQLDDIVT
jgi:hypothetical protein